MMASIAPPEKDARLRKIVQEFHEEQNNPDTEKTFLITNEWLLTHGKAIVASSYTRVQLALLGHYPVVSGWKNSVIGVLITQERARLFESSRKPIRLPKVPKNLPTVICQKKKPTPKRLRRLKGKKSWESVIPLKKMTYREYLQSDAWALKREQVFAKYGRKCVDCGRTDNLQVHHKTYKRLFQERLSDLEPVCPDHHLDRHPELLADKLFKEYAAIVG